MRLTFICVSYLVNVYVELVHYSETIQAKQLQFPGINVSFIFQLESFEYLRMSIDDVLRLDEDIESPSYPGKTI